MAAAFLMPHWEPPDLTGLQDSAWMVGIGVMKRCFLIWLAAAWSVDASPRLEFALGVLANQRGDREAAAAAFERAREEDPAAFPLMTRVAGLRAGAGDVTGASTLYREFAENQPQRLDAQVVYADFLRSASPNDDFAAKLARQVLEKADGAFPDQLAVKQRLFRIYEGLGERERSAEVFEATAGAALNPEGALAAADMARTLFPKDDLNARERVDGLLREAVTHFPGDPVLARAASEHFRTTSRLPEAAEMLSLHVAAVPSSLALRTRLGILHLAAGNEEVGEAIIQEVVAIDGNQGLAHQSLAKLYRQQERAKEARHHAAETLKLRGGEAREFESVADEFLAADLPREARLLLEKAVFYHPEDVGVAAKLAVAASRDPESKPRASRMFREVESMPGEDGPKKDPVFLGAFAESLYESGQTRAAEERLRTAIRTFPPEMKKETAAALRRLAGIWQAEQRNEEAAHSLLERADGLDPQ